MRRLTALSSTISTETLRQRQRPEPSRPATADVSNVAVKWKVLPAPGCALDPDPPRHHLDERRRDRQPQPGAAEPPRRRAVRLAERLEDRGVLLRRNADAGVADQEVQRRAARRRAASSRTSSSTWPLSVNLMALPTQVREHLPQPHRIADDRGGNRRIEVAEQLEPLLIRRRSDSVFSRSLTSVPIEKGIASSSSLRDSIFEKSRMSLRIASSDSADDLTVVRQSRCSAVSSLSSASSVMPMMPFIGVRISWLMLARNSLLARLASIALSRAPIEIGVGGAQLGGARLDRLLELLLLCRAAAGPAPESRRASR